MRSACRLQAPWPSPHSTQCHRSPLRGWKEGLSAMARAVGAIRRLDTRKLSPSELQSQASCSVHTRGLLLCLLTP